MVVGERGTRWIFGFDGGCGTCGYLAQQMVELSDGKLTARSLRSAEAQAWRELALGPDAPWAPTLFAIAGEHVRAWTGNALIARLGRLVGPHKLWRIATIVGGLMDEAEGPVSPARRLAVRQGLVGTAAAFALMSGTGPSQITALVQGSGGVVWRANQLPQAGFNAMERRADDDHRFQLLRQHFVNDGGGLGVVRVGTRIELRGTAGSNATPSGRVSRHRVAMSGCM